MEKIFVQGFHRIHGWELRRLLSGQSDKSVVEFLPPRLAALCSFVAQIDPPPTAIQPGPLAVGTSQYKSVQVNITKQKNVVMNRHGKNWRQKNVLLLSSRPHPFAFPGSGLNPELTTAH
jgi:hypothetical protein